MARVGVWSGGLGAGRADLVRAHAPRSSRVVGPIGFATTSDSLARRRPGDHGSGPGAMDQSKPGHLSGPDLYLHWRRSGSAGVQLPPDLQRAGAGPLEPAVCPISQRRWGTIHTVSTESSTQRCSSSSTMPVASRSSCWLEWGAKWDLYRPVQMAHVETGEGRPLWASLAGLASIHALLPFGIAGVIILRRRRIDQWFLLVPACGMHPQLSPRWSSPRALPRTLRGLPCRAGCSRDGASCRAVGSPTTSRDRRTNRRELARYKWDLRGQELARTYRSQGHDGSSRSCRKVSPGTGRRRYSAPRC